MQTLDLNNKFVLAKTIYKLFNSENATERNNIQE
jgi:hypothetical protein